MDTIKKGWQKEYFDAPNEIFDAPISGHAKIVYLYLCRCADAQKKAFPGYADIAKKTGFSRATVRRAISELGEMRLLIKVHNYNPETKRFKSNEYRLIHPKYMLSESTPMLSESTPMLSESTPMLSESTPMLSESTPMLSESTYKYPGKRLIKNTHEKDIIKKEEPASAEPGQALGDDDDVRGVEKYMTAKGMKAARSTVQKWLRMGDAKTVRAAIDEAAERPEVRNPVGYITTLLRNGYTAPTEIVSEPAGKGKRNRDSKYAAFYALMESSQSRGGLIE